MKTYIYADLDIFGNHIDVTMSENEIIDFYFQHWSERMKEIGKADLISRDNCIRDFVVVNWASEVKASNDC